jgi:hypothetical protein
MIAFHCTNCGKGLRVKDALAGKRVKCPACGTALPVPAAPAAAAGQPEAAPATLEEERPAPAAAGQPAEPAPKETIAADDLVQAVREGKPVGPLRDLIVEGDVNIASCNYPFPLEFERCVFKGRFNAAGAAFAKAVVLADCVFEAQANLEAAQVTGKLVLTGSTFGTPESAGQAAVFRLVRVSGDLSIDGVTAHGNLDFGGCKVEGNFDMEGAGTGGNLSLQVAQIGGGLYAGPLQVPSGDQPRPLRVGGRALLGGVKVQGYVDFRGAQITDDLNLLSAEIRCGLSCSQAHVGGDLSLHAARVSSRVDGTGLQVGKDLVAPGARIEGELELSQVAVGGSALLGGIEVGGPLRFEGAKVTGNLHLFSAVVKGGLSCGPAGEQPLEVKGDLALPAARVGGEARFDQARIQGQLRLEDASIDGNLLCFNLDHGVPGEGPAQAKGNVTLARAQVSGAVHFDGAQLQSDLVLECAQIRGGFFCRSTDRRAVIHGNLMLPGAQVSGAVNLNGARVEGTLGMIGTKLTGDFYCGTVEIQGEKHPTELGEASLVGAELTGLVYLFGTQVERDLNLHGAKLRGVLCQPWESSVPRFNGEVHLSSVEISGDIHLREARLGKNLNMVSAKIGGNLYAPRCEVGSAEEAAKGAEIGEVNMVLAHVAGIVYFSGSSIARGMNLSGAEIGVGFAFGTDDGQAPRVGGQLELQFCQIKSVELDGGVCPNGTIKLNGARFAKLEFEKGLPRALDMEGLEFQTLALPKKGDQRDYLGLLRATEPFDQSTYVSMERWLKNRGEEDEANRVYLDMRRRQRRELTRGLTPLTPRWFGRWSRRLLNLAWDTFIYVAVTTSTALVLYLLVALAATTWLFSNPASVTVKEPRAGQEAPGGTTSPEDWNGIRAAAMSLQINVPLVPIHAVEKWRPSDKPLPGFARLGYTYGDYADVVGLLSSVAVALLAGSISNKLSRRRATEG